MTVNVHMTRVEVAAGPQTTSQHRPRTNVQHLKEVPLLCPIYEECSNLVRVAHEVRQEEVAYGDLGLASTCLSALDLKTHSSRFRAAETDHVEPLIQGSRLPPAMGHIVAERARDCQDPLHVRSASDKPTR
jgi:hypothetical protein